MNLVRLSNCAGDGTVVGGCNWQECSDGGMKTRALIKSNKFFFSKEICAISVSR